MSAQPAAAAACVDDEPSGMPRAPATRPPTMMGAPAASGCPTSTPSRVRGRAAARRGRRDRPGTAARAPRRLRRMALPCDPRSRRRLALRSRAGRRANLLGNAELREDRLETGMQRLPRRVTRKLASLQHPHLEPGVRSRDRGRAPRRTGAHDEQVNGGGHPCSTILGRPGAAPAKDRRI